MKWKNFKEEKPPTIRDLVVRIRYLGKEVTLVSCFKRPFDAMPEVYKEDYYKMKIPTNNSAHFPFAPDGWLGIVSDLDIEIKWMEIPNE